MLMIQEIFLATWNVQLDTMHLDSIGFKAVAGYVMGLHPIESSFLLVGGRREKRKTRLDQEYICTRKKDFFSYQMFLTS